MPIKTLAAALLAAAAFAAQAAPFAITHRSQIALSTFPEVTNTQTYTLTLVFDSGSATAQSQTWQPQHLVCAVWRMNSGATAAYTQTTFGGTGFTNRGFTTDAQGGLIAIPDFFQNNGQFNDAYTTIGLTLTGTPHWNSGTQGFVFLDQTPQPRRSFGTTWGSMTRGLYDWTHPVAVDNPCATPPIEPIGPALNPAATPGNGQVTLQWQPPAPMPGGTLPFNYVVRAQPGGAECNARAPATTCTVAGLTNGTAYTFTVTTNGGLGGSTSVSAPVTATPLAALGPGGVQPVPTLSQWGGAAAGRADAARGPAPPRP